jgi:hypothetical protein
MGNSACDAECKAAVWDDPAYKAMQAEVDRRNREIDILYLDFHKDYGVEGADRAVAHLQRRVRELRAPFERRIAAIEDKYYTKEAEECLKSLQRVERNFYHPFPAYHVKKQDGLPYAVDHVIRRLMKARHGVEFNGTIPRDDHNLLVFEIPEKARKPNSDEVLLSSQIQALEARLVEVGYEIVPYQDLENPPSTRVLVFQDTGPLRCFEERLRVFPRETVFERLKMNMMWHNLTAMGAWDCRYAVERIVEEVLKRLGDPVSSSSSSSKRVQVMGDCEWLGGDATMYSLAVVVF